MRQSSISKHRFSYSKKTEEKRRSNSNLFHSICQWNLLHIDKYTKQRHRYMSSRVDMNDWHNHSILKTTSPSFETKTILRQISHLDHIVVLRSQLDKYIWMIPLYSHKHPHWSIEEMSSFFPLIKSIATFVIHRKKKKKRNNTSFTSMTIVIIRTLTSIRVSIVMTCTII